MLAIGNGYIANYFCPLEVQMISDWYTRGIANVNSFITWWDRTPF